MATFSFFERQKLAVRTKERASFVIVSEKGLRGRQHPLIAERTDDDYRKCMSTLKGKKESEAMLVIEGSSVVLSCPICLPPKAKAEAIWRSFLPDKASFVPVRLDGKRVRVLSDLSLEVSDAWRKDSGIYLCFKEMEIMAKYSIDVVRLEPHRFILMNGKMKKDKGPSKDVALKELNLVIGMTWSEWSECSRCDNIGKRRRVGICTVRKLNPDQPTKPEDCEYLNEYKRGIPCRSELLPKKMKELSVIQDSKSEFVIGFCKIPCPSKATIREVTDKTGKVIDTVDNSKGIYSMHQPLPKLPALVKRRVVHEAVGKSIIMACPGNIEGKFFTWRNDSYIINPNKVHKLTNGRVKIDLANNLHIRKLRYSDTAIYSCWDDKKLIGTIRLQITDEEMGESYRFYILNTALLFTFMIILMISITVCKNVTLQSKE